MDTERTQPRQLRTPSWHSEDIRVSGLGSGGCESSACLTLEVGSELHGLARPQVLADHLLEANMGDLDQVSCGEAAFIPGDLVDGA